MSRFASGKPADKGPDHHITKQKGRHDGMTIRLRALFLSFMMLLACRQAPCANVVLECDTAREGSVDASLAGFALAFLTEDKLCPAKAIKHVTLTSPEGNADLTGLFQIVSGRLTPKVIAPLQNRLLPAGPGVTISATIDDEHGTRHEGSLALRITASCTPKSNGSIVRHAKTYSMVFAFPKDQPPTPVSFFTFGNLEPTSIVATSPLSDTVGIRATTTTGTTIYHATAVIATRLRADGIDQAGRPYGRVIDDPKPATVIRIPAHPDVKCLALTLNEHEWLFDVDALKNDTTITHDVTEE